MPKLIILIGIPGSGKSTFARKLVADMPDAIVISYDAIREQLYGDASIQGEFSEIKAESNKLQFIAKLTQTDVIIDNCNCSPKYIAQWLKAFPGYESIAYQCACSLQQAIANQVNRKRQVPADVIERMWHSLKQINLLDFPFSERHYI